MISNTADSCECVHTELVTGDLVCIAVLCDSSFSSTCQLLQMTVIVFVSTVSNLIMTIHISWWKQCCYRHFHISNQNNAILIFFQFIFARLKYSAVNSFRNY